MTHLDRRREAIAAAWDLTDEIVLIGAGQLAPIPGTDQFHGFRAHPEFRYLADSERPGEVLAYDPREGWTLFSPALTADEQVWHGRQEPAGRPLSELAPWLVARRQSSFALLGCPVDRVAGHAGLGTRLSDTLSAARRTKDPDEQERMRAAAAATRTGFLAAMSEARPGLTERRIEAELEAGFRRGGGRRPAFDSIVAGGPNAAVLHFEPTDRELSAGELLLIDAGAEFGGYACDCTRTFVPGGGATPEQEDLHRLVLEVQEAALAQCVPGAEYKRIHLEANERMAQGLVDFGLLKGSVPDLLERDAQALFFPHGIGHLVGLAVHDAGGYVEGRTPEDRPGVRYLRADLPLEPGYAVTIEPGIYFIEALLQNPGTRERYRDAVDWTRVDALARFGGIRIEDTLLVTDGAPEVLTGDIPKGLAV